MSRLLICLAVCLPSLAGADTAYWDYRDWRVVVETVDTGQDLRVTCTALTGGDGDPSLRIAVSNGDALPPDYFPATVLHEGAIRGYPTMMQDGNRVLFTFDDGALTEGFVSGGFDAEGFAWAEARTNDGDNLWLLQQMRKARDLWITLDGEVVYRASLSGFTAAYGKIAEQCGFPTVGVITP